MAHAERRDPRAVRIVDWWETNQHRFPDAMWIDAFWYWIQPLALGDLELVRLYHDTSAEHHTRNYLRARGLL